MRGLERELVADWSQAENAADRNVGEIRVMPEFLAREDIAQVHFDEWNAYSEKRIAQRDAGMRETARVDDDEGNLLTLCRVYFIDQLVFGVALRRGEFMSQRTGDFLRPSFNILERGCAIDAWLACPEQIQVWAVEQKNSGHPESIPATSRHKGPR